MYVYTIYCVYEMGEEMIFCPDSSGRGWAFGNIEGTVSSGNIGYRKSCNLLRYIRY